jgi:hypothetical protein
MVGNWKTTTTFTNVENESHLQYQSMFDNLRQQCQGATPPIFTVTKTSSEILDTRNEFTVIHPPIDQCADRA